MAWHVGQGQDILFPKRANDRLTFYLTKLTKVFFLNKVYMTQTIFCLFERPFKVQKNGVFLFEKSFFVLEILTLFYYAN